MIALSENTVKSDNLKILQKRRLQRNDHERGYEDDGDDNCVDVRLIELVS